MAKLKTGIGIAGLSGTSGGAVFVERRDGSVIVRERPVQLGQPTDRQREAKRLFQFASRQWATLTLEEQRAWLLWARHADPFAGADGAVRAYVSLTVRWLAVNGGPGDLHPQPPPHLAGDEPPRSKRGGGAGETPSGLRPPPPLAGTNHPANGGGTEMPSWLIRSGVEPPRLPPATPFGGDAVAVTVESQPGALSFEADRPNGDGVVTELMAAKVRSALAEPRDRDYRIVGRARFVTGGLRVTVPVLPGRYAVAVRFVKVATGQSSGVLRLGVVAVPA